MYKQSAFGRVKPKREPQIPENYSGNAFTRDEGGFALYEAVPDESESREEPLEDNYSAPASLPMPEHERPDMLDFLGRIGEKLGGDNILLLLVLLVLIGGGGKKDDGAIIMLILLLLI